RGGTERGGRGGGGGAGGSGVRPDSTVGSASGCVTTSPNRRHSSSWVPRGRWPRISRWYVSSTGRPLLARHGSKGGRVWGGGAPPRARTTRGGAGQIRPSSRPRSTASAREAAPSLR